MKLKNNRKNNLKKSELTSLEDLQQREDVVITKEDKGRAVVFQDVSDYINETNRQLNDPVSYTHLTLPTIYSV